MRVIFATLFFIILANIFPQAKSQEDNSENRLKPASLCSDVKQPPNGNCFDFLPAIPIVEGVREALGDDVFVHIISLVEVEVFTEDVGLSSDEIYQRLETASLQDGRSLADIIFVVEGGIPERFYQRIESRDIQ